MKYSSVALIFGGGTGVRASTHGVPKQFVRVKGEPIIIQTVKQFEKSPVIDAVVLVCVEGYVEYLRNLVSEYKLTKVVSIVKGGASGQESIYNGLIAINNLDLAQDAVVFIHDAVRPLISSPLLSNCLNAVRRYGSAIASVVCYETVASRVKEQVREIYPRSELVLLRAPQVFYVKDIYRYHEMARASGLRDTFTDSASLAKHYGHTIHLVESSSKNIKITYPEDIYILNALLDAEEHSEIFGTSDSSLND